MINTIEKVRNFFKICRFDTRLKKFSLNPDVTVEVDEIRARDGDGLKLYDDGGNGIFVADGGNVGIGTTSPDHLFHMMGDEDDNYFIFLESGFTRCQRATSENLTVFVVGSDVDNMFIVKGDRIHAKGISRLTTTNAANMYIENTYGQMYRSTSSGKFKTDVRGLEKTEKDKTNSLRPVRYKSLCEADEGKEFFGFIAEEIAEVDPCMASWGYTKDDFDTVDDIEDGKKVGRKTVLKKDAVKSPIGLDMNCIVAVAVSKVQEQQTEIDSLIVWYIV